MRTFLMTAGLPPGRALAVLKNAHAVLEAVAPEQTPRPTRWQDFPEIGGGWFYRDGAIGSANVVDEFVSPSLAVFLVGRLFPPTPHSARAAADAWEAGGVRAVRSLSGSFASVIIDRRERRVYLLSDIVGHWAFRYFHSQGGLLVSTHDLSIMSSGLCPADFDLTSVASVLSFDYSIGNKSLLRPIQVCDPRAYVRWQNGTVRAIRDPLINLDERIDAKDERSLAAQNERMIEHARQKAYEICSSQSEVRVSLTAGRDTRAVLGILLSSVAKEQLTVYTYGADGILDVQMARRLAKAKGLPVLREEPPALFPEAFDRRMRALAPEMNGDLSCSWALGPEQIDQQGDPLNVGGLDGEIYDGRFSLRPMLDIREGLVELVGGGNLGKLPWRSQGVSKPVEQRLGDVLTGLEEISSNRFDMIDQYVLYELAAGRCNPNSRLRNRWLPFMDADLLKMLFRLPAPIGRFCRFHQTVIRRFFPEAYCLPINGRGFLPGCRAQKWLHRMKGLVRVSERAVPNDDWLREVLAGPLKEHLRDSLMSVNGLAIELFGRSGLQDFIDAKSADLRPLASLLLIERWRSLVLKARKVALSTS